MRGNQLSHLFKEFAICVSDLGLTFSLFDVFLVEITNDLLDPLLGLLDGLFGDSPIGVFGFMILKVFHVFLIPSLLICAKPNLYRLP